MSKTLIVTGMHRSGTSLVANYLHRAGISMGDALLSGDVGNPRGYYEDAEIHEFHRQLLWRSGIEDAFTVREQDVPIPFSDQDLERAREIARSRAQKEQWGWKDPRTALFLDLWAEALPDAYYVFLFRDPLAVLDSLLRRASNRSVMDDPALALNIWRTYNTQMHQFGITRRDRAVWFEVSTILEDPNVLLRTLNAAFGFSTEDTSFESVFDPAAFHRQIRGKVRFVAARHRSEVNRCRRLYQELLTLADPIRDSMARD